MKGDIIVKVKLGSMKKSIENFGADRCLIKTDIKKTMVPLFLDSQKSYWDFLGSIEHNLANHDIITRLSRYMGVPENKIILKSGITSEDKVFQLVM